MLTLLGAAAGAAAALALRRRREAEARVAPVDPRAEELRRRLAQARETPPDEEDFEAAGMAAEIALEPETDAPPPPLEPASLAEARRKVHEEGRAVAEEMRRPRER